MKLFTKEIDNLLFKQYPFGNNLADQVVAGKIFNPYGRGRWYLLNSDPNDPDYIWAIVQMGDVVEIGSVSRSELQRLRVGRFQLPLERDLNFPKINAKEMYEGLVSGKMFRKGGWVTDYAAKGAAIPKRKYKVGDEGMYRGGEYRITEVDDTAYTLVELDEDGNPDGYPMRVTIKRLDESFAYFPPVQGEQIDLFEDFSKMPADLRKVVEKYAKKSQEESVDYKDTAKLLRDVRKLGYTFNYYLDNEPYGLRPIGVKLYQLKGYEEFKNEDAEPFAEGGIVLTKIKDIPDLKKEIESGRVTYRGLGLGKLDKEFYKKYGTGGTRIRVKGKEYFITDDEYKKLEWDEKKERWRGRIKFSAPRRSS